ncbi:MAG: creatininase family protein [Hyphomicrobiaceae bacterium]|nr:creatininase family protein [Hyphomicrobiaceae bacterium]
MLPLRHWRDMTTVDFATAATRDWIAVLPIAAIEQHGPHLPVATDQLIAEAQVARVVELLPAGLPATFLPVQAIGKSNEHISSPGSLTFDWETVTKAWIEIGDSVARAGVRKMVIVTSHGGNVPIMDIVARELRVKYDMLCVATGWARFGNPPGVFSERELRYGIHGGDRETSMILAFRPDLVRMERAEDFHSTQERLEQEMRQLRLHGTVQFGWKAQDANPAGVVGEAHLATAEKGRLAIDHAANGFIELLHDVARFDLARLWRPEG